MNILITGGAGYIGSVLVRELLNQGYRVRVLDNFLFGQNSLMDCCYEENFEVISGDVRNSTIIQEAIQGQDVIIPLAALVGAPLCDRDPSAAKGINVEAIQTLAKLLSKEQRILMPISNSGYGIGEDIFCTEESPLKPISLYGKTKVEAENIVLDRGNAISFRLATVFGASPRMRLDLLVNNFTYRAVKDGFVVVFEGHFKRNYIHIRDVSRAFIHGIQGFEKLKDQVYNLGLSSANLSKLELCEKIKEQVPKFVYLESEIGKDPDQRNYIVSNEKIEKTGFQTIFSLEKGIRELIQAYRILGKSQHSNV